jgi:hypothetical protein
MNPNWQNIMQRLNAYPAGIHRSLSPCPDERIRAVQSALGEMPNALVEMLKLFNGAELFVRNSPMVTIFGISANPPLPPLEWAADWYIDKFTPVWRSTNQDRQTDWAIAMMNYGGLIILGQDGTAREWDTSQGTREPKTWEFGKWVDDVLHNGESYMQE